MAVTFNASAVGLIQTSDLSGTINLQTANTTAIFISATQTINCTSTGAVIIPSGTTAQRPDVPSNGMIRYNTTESLIEGYKNGNWVGISKPLPYSVSYLLIGGGGGSGVGQGGGGGGGGGGSNASSFTAVVGTTYTITVGGGGSPQAGGSNSAIVGVNTKAGGNPGGNSPDQNAGGNGGTSGNGFTGSNGSFAPNQYSGGGGGAAASVSGTNGGGAGISSSITGSATFYGGGGGGTAGGGGGVGGGGTGSGAVAGTNGGANTGGGAGGGNNTGSPSGGSGVVVLSLPTISYTGITTGSPTVTTSGSNTILKYTASGTYTA